MGARRGYRTVGNGPLHATADGDGDGDADGDSDGDANSDGDGDGDGDANSDGDGDGDGDADDGDDADSNASYCGALKFTSSSSSFDIRSRYEYTAPCGAPSSSIPTARRTTSSSSGWPTAPTVEP